MSAFGPAMSVANALLYEGYALYPYRASSLKNRRRFDFGCLFPAPWCDATDQGDASSFRAECLVRARSDATVAIALRFLQLVQRDGWHEAFEREAHVRVSLRAGTTERAAIAFAPIRGDIAASVERIDEDTARIAVVVRNDAACAACPRDEALTRALVSTHALFHVESGRFVSLLEPPPELADAAAKCTNTGVWPVLIGPRDDLLLASPIILYDHPRVADESPGDLFDASEIDEILTLRVLTLTDDEKRAARALDARTRALLERTEALDPASLSKLHGALREAPPARGTRVVLRPRARADVFDLALAGRTATIVGTEVDAEGRAYATVAIDDDPGRDFAEAGLPGHRFFFYMNEIERLP
jgi:hydrogenase maturation protease